MQDQKEKSSNTLKSFITSKPEHLSKKAQKFQLEVIKQMLTLATSGFGLVAALAWNELIKETLEEYVKPYLPQGSGVVSLLIYAILVTFLAVFITVNLTRIKQRFEQPEDKES